MKRKPSLNGTNSRDVSGKFLPGHPGGPGNPLAKRVNQVRSMILAEISQEDLRVIIKKLISQAKHGDLVAIREVLDRCIGKSVSFPAMREVERQIHLNQRYRLPWEENEND